MNATELKESILWRNGSLHRMPATLPEDVYAILPGVRSTWLKIMRRSPGHLIKYLNDPAEPTQAMKFGSLFHQAMHSGVDKLPVIMVDDELNLNTKEGRKIKEEAELQGRSLIREETFNRILAMKAMLLADRQIGPMFQGGLTEVPAIARIPVGEHQLICKAKVDLVPDGDFLVDYKCVSSAEVDQFARLAYRLGYHLQAHHYMRTWNRFIEDTNGEKEIESRMLTRRDKFLIIAIESEPPHAYRSYMFNDEFLRIGENHWLESATSLIDCTLKGEFPLYPSSIAVLKPPQKEDIRWMEEEL